MSRALRSLSRRWCNIANRFWDHVIRDDRDLENHLHYIHYNPVKHGYVTDPRDWRDSSYIEWEKCGLYPSLFKWEKPEDIEWGE